MAIPKHIYRQTDGQDRTTLVSYFGEKLYQALREIESNNEQLLRYVEKESMDDIIKRAEDVRKHQQMHKDITREFACNCNITDILDYKEYLHIDTIVHVFKYTKSITVRDRDRLIQEFGYRFSDCKIKS